MSKPRITANQVTFLRLALTPIPCWLLYQGTSGQFAALVFATLLGCTDFVDGYLARKHGPTVLGGLMDPIADKVFIAITFLPAADLGWSSPWLVAALFAREFVVTATRSIYEKRGVPLKSSYLARYKTWVQMLGVAFLMLLHTVSSRTMDILLASSAVLPVVFFVARYLIVKKPWKGAAAYALTFSVLWVLHELGGGELFGVVLSWFILGITYASGLGYLLSIGKLSGRGAVTAGEWLRLVSALALPILIVVLQRQNLGPKWALIALASIELAHGGLDNLLAHHHAEAGLGAWGARVVGELALLGYAWWADSLLIARIACIGAFAIGALGLALAFAQKRRYYLDPPAPSAKPLSVPSIA